MHNFVCVEYRSYFFFCILAFLSNMLVQKKKTIWNYIPTMYIISNLFFFLHSYRAQNNRDCEHIYMNIANLIYYQQCKWVFMCIYSKIQYILHRVVFHRTTSCVCFYFMKFITDIFHFFFLLLLLWACNASNALNFVMQFGSIHITLCKTKIYHHSSYTLFNLSLLPFCSTILSKFFMKKKKKIR